MCPKSIQIHRVPDNGNINRRRLFRRGYDNCIRVFDIIYIYITFEECNDRTIKTCVPSDGGVGRVSRIGWKAKLSVEK